MTFLQLGQKTFLWILPEIVQKMPGVGTLF